MKNRVKIFLIMVMMLSISCQKQMDKQINPSPLSENSFKGIFDTFWNEMNRNYVMWDIDTTHWDDMYRNFSPVFSKLQIKNPTDRLLASHYLRKMTTNLLDGHYSLQFNDSLLRDSSIIPADIRITRRPDYHGRYQAGYFDHIAQYYLDQPYYDAAYNTDLQHSLRYIAGTINHHILYFRINTFSIYRAYHSKNTRMVALINFVFNSLKNIDIKGIIIDLRDNTGGDLQDLNFFTGHFINAPLQYGTSRYKSNQNPFDYTPWMPAVITPIADSQKFTKNIVILVNMYSISMSELTTMALKTLPNTTVIGERTYGANGLLTVEEDLNSGSFNIGNFASIKTASALFRYKDNHIYEGTGFPPDIYVPYVDSEAMIYTDKQLEKAISIFAH